MPIFQAGGAPSTLSAILSSWQMSFSSIHFLLFLPLVLGGCFVLPKKARPGCLLLCSYYFYFFAAPKYLPVLLGGTLAAWLCGLFIASRKSGGTRRAAMLCSVALLVLMLCFFKYNGFFAPLFAPLLGTVGIGYSTGYFTTAGALGLSFYCFTAIGYLIDVGRGDAPAEKNPLYFALFLGWFPSVTMGPILRAGELLPQLRALPAGRFDAARVTNGLRRMAVGYFKKLAVADMLAVYTGQIYGSLHNYSGLTLIFAAICFVLQLYFDFAGYSDIAIGAAGLFGIKLPENFITPYYATNFSGFWRRWHISLSTWFLRYVYIPLGGSRVSGGRHLLNLTAVFLLSGLWHGDTLCFFVWGALMALCRVGEELLHRMLGRPRENSSRLGRAAKTAAVFILWAEGFVFFKVGMTPGLGLGDAFSSIKRQFASFSPTLAAGDIMGAVQTGFFPKPVMAAAFIGFSLFCLALALWGDWAQYHRLKGAPVSDGIARLSAAPRWIIYYVLVLCCFAAFIAKAGANFLYGGF